MDEREGEYLRQCIRELEQSNRRWKIATFALLVLWTLLIIPGGLVLLWQASVGGRMARMEAEAARMQAEEAAQRARQAEQAARLAQPTTKGAQGTEAAKGTKARPTQQATDKGSSEGRPKDGARGEPIP